MSNKLGIVFLWFLITPLFLSSTVFLLYSNIKIPSPNKTNFPVIIFQTKETNSLNGQVLGTKLSDIRPYILERFLRGTPLEPYSEYLVEVADSYNLDYRLIPAIAMKESRAGATARAESHNAWGFENGRTKFESWEEAIDTVGKTLRRKYADKGLVTPEQIMPVYAPPQILTGGKWARDINYFFLKMENL